MKSPSNKGNAADDELRFAPFLAADRQGRSAAWRHPRSS